MNFRNKHWWIVRLWRIVVLFLGFAGLILASVSWILTGDLQPVFLIACASFLIISVAYSVYALFSVNIFRGRMPRLQSRSERLFVWMCALGLYLAVAGAILFTTFFVFLQLLQIPWIIVIAVAVVEFALFSVVGYISFIRFRRTIQWLSEKESP
jgi:hypothetical protein